MLFVVLHAGAAESARGHLEVALQLLTQLATNMGAGIARSLLTANILGTVRQLWMLAHTELPLLQALLRLLSGLACSGAPFICAASTA